MLQVSCNEIYSGFFLKDDEFVSRIINDSNIDLETFPASKVRHIKPVASHPQAAQVNLMRHQRTDLLPSKSKWKQHSHMQRSKSQKRYSNEHENERPPSKKCDPSQAHKKRDRCSVCMQNISSVLPGSSSAGLVINMVILPACATKSNHLLSQEIPRHANCKQE